MADHGAPVRYERSQKRVRVRHGGAWIADSTRPLFVWEHPRPYPYWWLDRDDVDGAALVPTGRATETRWGSTGEIHDVRVGDHVAPGAALVCTGGSVGDLVGTVRFTFGAVDAWFEEDEQIFVHPRDPYARIDILRSSRRVRVEIDGTTIAESDQPTFLFETGVPRRTYLPAPHVRGELLVPSSTRTQCPYKGTASYWSVQVGGQLHEDLAWYYRLPTRESAPIAGLVCFYDERVDLWVDGELQDRPITPWSPRTAT